ncbi:LysM peptidoglycan-binding domain-containing protein, partial [Micromonospora echinofusca]
MEIDIRETGERYVQSRVPDRHDTLTEYGTRDTVYLPHDPPSDREPLPRTLARTVHTVSAILLFLIAVPTLLWMVGGNPMRRLPAWSQIPEWFDKFGGRFTPDVLVGAALWGMWLLWGAFALLLIAELVAAATRWRIPVVRLPAPLHRLVFGLAGTAALAVTSVGNPNDAGDDGRAATTVAAADIPRQAAARGPAIIRVAEHQYIYVVERHDTLSTIAKQWLGDANRWPEICALNKHRHFAKGARGVLRDCDLIYPGWDLRLPADARPPAGTT